MDNKDIWTLTYPRIIVIIIILFPICNFFKSNSLIGYYDEFIAVVSIVILFKYKLGYSFEKSDKWILYGMFIVTAIGIASNAISGLTSNLFAILVDVLWLWKIFATFLAFKYISAKNNRRRKILKLLDPIAKFAIGFVCASALIGEIIDIGVTGSTVIGVIKAFNFFWTNGIQTGWLVFCCVLIVSAAENNRKNILRYLIIALIPLILTFSSLVWCWCFLAISVLILLRENAEIKVWSIALIVAGVIVLNYADISTYLVGGHIRGTLIRYGIITAQNYFPFGSGFATYGSEMAVRDYSQLYVKYGWASTWAFGRE